MSLCKHGNYSDECALCIALIPTMSERPTQEEIDEATKLRIELAVLEIAFNTVKPFGEEFRHMITERQAHLYKLEKQNVKRS